MRHRIVGALGAAIGLTLALNALAAPAHKARLIGSFTWQGEDERFGGFSGLELSDDGLTLTTISDRGSYVTARLTRQDGRVTAIDADPIKTLRDYRATDIKGGGDAEGLAIAQDGRWFVSLEAFHRVVAYSSLDTASWVPIPDEFTKLQHNSGLEALAVDDAGRLYAIPERSGGVTQPFSVYRFEDKVWTTPFTLPRDGGFLPVGADFGPDGRLYLLEREFSGFGFRSRVRRFTLDGDAIAGSEILLTTSTWTHGNLEGIAVWQDTQGTHLTMISDDNFQSFLRTELVDYVVTD